MSADSAQQDLEATPEDLPDVGVRSRKQYSKKIHRRRDAAEDPRPACREHHRGDRFKTCHPQTLLAFARWSLCGNPECFGEDDGVDRGDGTIADGGKPVEHYLDSAGDQLETALEKSEDDWQREAIAELREDLAALQGFERDPSAAAFTDAGNGEVFRGP
ncbi:hypothetical protein HWV23_03330 [Natronomonas halophila]|uniref:hypothetical protein n=1 Tax=Natronomonas halophila TaxID=2747817 RepID=UPI0015B6E95F|nr:hypothetical protein [Natronomonas halophila]QLD84783.1 hypothetical protein HWV23_03330 [Natronomonas halophila]